MKLTAPIVLLILAGCSAKEIKPGAERILVTRQPAPKTCKFVGQIMGEQGRSLSGKYTSNKNLAEGAMNDMRNHALDLGANYVVLEESKAGQTGGLLVSRQTDVTQVGNAYRCIPSEIGL